MALQTSGIPGRKYTASEETCANGAKLYRTSGVCRWGENLGQDGDI